MPYPNISTTGIPTSGNGLTTDTTTIAHAPNRPTFPANASSFYFPNISNTIAAPVNANSTTLAVESITGTLPSAPSTPPVKATAQIITTVRPGLQINQRDFNIEIELIEYWHSIQPIEGSLAFQFDRFGSPD